MAADASALFEKVQHFNAAETVVVVDPPRKGCGRDFLQQLLDFGPERVMYVSCNVHTQALDVGWLLHGGDVSGKPDAEDALATSQYEIESIRGFDFFPQTSHVESVAVLRRKPA